MLSLLQVSVIEFSIEIHAYLVIGNIDNIKMISPLFDRVDEYPIKIATCNKNIFDYYLSKS